MIAGKKILTFVVVVSNLTFNEVLLVELIAIELITAIAVICVTL